MVASEFVQVRPKAFIGFSVQVSVFRTAASGAGFITTRNEVSQTSWEARKLGRWNV